MDFLRDGIHSTRGDGRVRALTDGVFAIVLTLLVFRFDASKVIIAETNVDFWREVRTQLPALLGFALAFPIIATFWILHQRAFRMIVRSSNPHVWLNFIFLGVLSLLPVTTSIHAGSPYLSGAWQLYAWNVSIAGATLLAIWLRALKTGAVDPLVPPGYRNYFVYGLAGIPIVYLVSIPISQHSVELAQWSPIGVPLVNWLAHRRWVGPEPLAQDSPLAEAGPDRRDQAA